MAAPRHAPEVWERRAGDACAPLARYRRREPEKTVLHQVVREGLETFLARARERSEQGRGLPTFVERELRAYLDCGILARGFARVRCPDCGFERLVAFSCKAHVCPSCATRRMEDGADHLVKTYSSPTGMTVNGSINVASVSFNNGVTASAVTNDKNVAWVEGQNKVDTNGPVGGDELSGKTLTAGVYHDFNLNLAAGGSATMNAQNDANAVFVFKVDSTMVDSGTLLLPTQIKLVNGAQAKNVYFVAGLDVTIGSGTTWSGTVLAGRDATVKTARP